MSQSNGDQNKDGDVDPGQSLDLGGIAELFNKWPGPTIMAVGAVLALAAAGIRIGGIEISDREFAGFEFGAVFFGGIVLIVLGVVVLMLRDRLKVADEERRLTQAHEVKLALGQAKVEAALRRGDQVRRSGNEAANMFDGNVEDLFMSAYKSPA